MSDDDERMSYIDVTTKSGFTIRLQPMGFDREGNQMWRQLGSARLGREGVR